MKAMKFRVENETQSRLLQNALFSRGYRWIADADSVREPKHTRSTYLFASSDGYLTQASHQETFDNNKYELCNAMTYIYKDCFDVSTDSPNRQIVLVEVLGKVYNKEELEAALSKITQYCVEK